MKRLSLALLACAAFSASAAHAAELNVDVKGLNSDKGEVFLALYNTAETWMKKPFKVERKAAAKGSTVVTFANLPEGDYALSVYHDEDGDRKMARNAVGMPLEPWGFSKDAMGMFGPPAFDDAKVTLPATGATIVINLKS